MNRRLKKGIKGQMILPSDDNTIRYINENIEVFKAVCDRDFEYCLFDLYEGTYEDKDVIGIDFNIMGNTFKECDVSFSRFKKEIKNHFGSTPKQVFTGKYDRI